MPAYGGGQNKLGQFWHAAPPEPHWVFDVPDTQLVALAQQPVQPESVLQVHTRLWQFSPEFPVLLQLEQVPPGSPQALSAVPGWHVAPAQHPEGQEVALHMQLDTPRALPQY